MASEQSSPEPIILEDIVLYDAQGHPHTTYKKVILDGGAVKDPSGDYLIKEPLDWIAYFNSLGNGKTLPSLALYCAIIERLGRRSFEMLQWREELRTYPFATSTRLDYAGGVITHGSGYAGEIPLEGGLLQGNYLLGELVRNITQRDALQKLLASGMLKQDIEAVVNDKCLLKIIEESPESCSVMQRMLMTKSFPLAVESLTDFSGEEPGICAEAYGLNRWPAHKIPSVLVKFGVSDGIIFPEIDNSSCPEITRFSLVFYTLHSPVGSLARGVILEK